jgi:aspartyl/asparaginyl-tRNA synthetase
MNDEKMRYIGKNIFGFQSSLVQSKSNLQEYLEKYYFKKWMSDELYIALSIRTTFVNSLQQFLIAEGLFNIEKLLISPVTDPLAHDVEHSPSISYKGQKYLTTHSMIYAKFLALHNPKIYGVFVDSPNLRLELESPDRSQRGKYLIDFSQMDIELRRNRYVDFESYLFDQDKTKGILKEDLENALDFFERMIVFATSELVRNNEDELRRLGVIIEVPRQPFPRFLADRVSNKYGRSYDVSIGKRINEQFFWIIGLLRENYDLIYPYLLPNGKVSASDITSEMIYNYDICAKSILYDTNKQTDALEILSGALREWIYEAIVERLVDNKIIPERPEIIDGNLHNIDKLGGYGPFLLIASMKNSAGMYNFPETYGGGIGIERTLFTLCRGKKISKIEDITYFGKNPDSHQIYLF